MKATFGAAGLLVVFVLLQVTDAVSMPWGVWVVLGLALASGVALDAVRAKAPR